VKQNWSTWCPPFGGLPALLIYIGLSVALTWPLIAGLTTDVPGDLGDSLLNMWILAWGAEHLPQLLTGAMSWSEFWNANIFHPEPLSLALSEHLFGQTLQILPVYWLTGNIILCYNLLFISTFVLSAFGAFLLVRDLTGDARAAFIAGLVYGFLPYRIGSVPHLQVLSSQWMPFALYGLNRFVTTRSNKALIGGTAALVMQNLSCGYYLIYFAPFVPLFVLHRMWSIGALANGRVWLGLIGGAIATLALTLPFLLPYREVQQVFGIERRIGEVSFFSANIWSYLTASEDVQLYGSWLRANLRPEQETFLGFTALILAAIAVALVAATPDASRARQPKAPSTARRIAAIVLAVAAASQLIALLSVSRGVGGDSLLAQIGYLDLPGRRTPAPGPVRPEARRAARDRRPVAAHRHQCPWHPDLRSPAATGPHDGQARRRSLPCRQPGRSRRRASV
jgi:hypothetical protein